MPGEFGEGTHTEGDKSASQEGEQGLYQPETMLNGGTGSSDPDQPDIPAVLRDRRDGVDEDLRRFRPLAERLGEEIAESGGGSLPANALNPILIALRDAYEMGASDTASHNEEASDVHPEDRGPRVDLREPRDTEKVKPKRLITKVLDAAGEALDGNLEGEEGDEA